MIARLLRVQPGEGRTVALLVPLMFVSFAGLTIGESAVNALFFDRVGSDALPVMYLAQGATGLAAVIALTAVLSRVDRRRAYVAIPVLIAVAVLAERLPLAAHPGWIYPALWLTATLAHLLLSVSLWGAAGVVTDTRAAKRLFPLFGAGGILGSVVGGLATKPLASAIGAPNLLVVWAVASATAAVVCGAALGRRVRTAPRRHRLRRRPPPAFRDIREGLSYVRRSPFLVWMTAAAVLFSVLFYSLYLPYAQVATERYPDPEELAGFFGVFWAAVTAAAFVASVLATNRLLGWFGAAAMVLLLPVLYVGAFGALLVSATFPTIVAVRFGVTMWLQGVTSPAWETLINVVPETRRDQVRAFLNGGPTQTGTAIAGVVTLVGQRALTSRQLSTIGLAVAVVTIVVAWLIRRSYTGALADALRVGRPSVFEGRAVQGPPIELDRDGQALHLALRSTADADPRVRRLAADLLCGDAQDARARDALLRLTDDPDGVVRATAIGGLSRAGRLERVVLERALNDEDPNVRLAAVRSVGASTVDAAPARGLVDDPDPAVAAAACVGLFIADPTAVDDRLRRLLSDDAADVRITALREVERLPPDAVVALARPLLSDPSPVVRAETLRALAERAPDAVTTETLEALGTGERLLREAVLEAFGRSGPAQQVSALVDGARAAARLAHRDHDLARSIASDGAAAALLRDALVARARSHAVAALSAIALASRDLDAMRAAVENLDGRDPIQLANALETLDTSEHRAIARPLLALWERAGGPAASGEDRLDELLGDPDPLIRGCAALVADTREHGDEMSRSRPTMSPIERILALRTVPLFSELTPAELQRVAAIAQERVFADGDVIAGEGESGDELHVVLSGSVAVVRGSSGDARTIARRGPGDVVGEMSVIRRRPRMASLVAEGDVRTLRIGHREFESMIRERPDVSLAVMRVLAERLDAQTTER